MINIIYFFGCSPIFPIYFKNQGDVSYMEAGCLIENRYEMVKEIGKGGMSHVYLAFDNRLQKYWAVKEIKKDSHKPFPQEISVLSRLNSVYMPRIVDYIENQDNIYMIMDYIEGNSLEKLMKEEGPLPYKLVLSFAKQLCEAFIYLHSLTPPIIYKDLKPSNIIIGKNNRISLIDFGIAKEYHSNDKPDTFALGTKGYAAPEQFGNSLGLGIYKTDERTDIYSMGILLHEMMFGRTFTNTAADDTSKEFRKIIRKCTQYNPGDRYRTCEEIWEDISSLENIGKRKPEYKTAKKLGAILMLLFIMLSGILSYVFLF